MWPHLGKEAKERKNEPVQQSQPGPLEPSASTLLTPARTLQVGLHPPHSRPCRPPLSPPQSRLALAQDLDTSSHALRPTGPNQASCHSFCLDMLAWGAADTG